MSLRHLASALALVLLFPLAGLAAPIFFDGGGGNLGTNTTSFTDGTNTINVYGYYFKTGTGWLPADLYQRTGGDDNGLGVCSPGEEASCGGDGNFSELSQNVNPEAIVLQRPAGTTWAGLWVSSLDAGGTGGTEKGIVNKLSANDPTAIFGLPFTFQFPAFLDPNAVQGDLGVPPGVFNPMFLMFRSNGAAGTDNDYLVWGAELIQGEQQDFPPSVPEPMSLLLVGSGLPGLAYWRKRSRR